jgi:hypothetical protein
MEGLHGSRCPAPQAGGKIRSAFDRLAPSNRPNECTVFLPSFSFAEISSKEAKRMKPRPAAVSPDEQHSCRRPGCPKVGKPRSQTRVKATRTLHLCDECFERLPAHQLNDLFLQCIDEQK